MLLFTTCEAGLVSSEHVHDLEGHEMLAEAITGCWDTAPKSFLQLWRMDCGILRISWSRCKSSRSEGRYPKHMKFANVEISISCRSCVVPHIYDVLSRVSLERFLHMRNDRAPCFVMRSKSRNVQYNSCSLALPTLSCYVALLPEGGLIAGCLQVPTGRIGYVRHQLSAVMGMYSACLVDISAIVFAVEYGPLNVSRQYRLFVTRIKHVNLSSLVVMLSHDELVDCGLATHTRVPFGF